MKSDLILHDLIDWLIVDWLIELSCSVPLDTKQFISKMFFPASLFLASTNKIKIKAGRKITNSQ